VPYGSLSGPPCSDWATLGAYSAMYDFIVAAIRAANRHCHTRLQTYRWQRATGRCNNQARPDT
jgi:hypothetical protein